jgi:hypothetical protein
MSTKIKKSVNPLMGPDAGALPDFLQTTRSLTATRSSSPLTHHVSRFTFDAHEHPDR